MLTISATILTIHTRARTHARTHARTRARTQRCTQYFAHNDAGHTLDLLPATNRSGLNQLHTPEKTSTWGGSVIYDKHTNLYHMYASEITRHCGIHRWVRRVVWHYILFLGSSLISVNFTNKCERSERGGTQVRSAISP